ncbi:unnamed protein product [Blepharisma stoltei]|uniref:Receptor ligand binding region domain-containing protein n=1 Tax=Blepharisma stoltei TaxID=1481888 RepID=A0AAU9JM13_9CILI|nr:unnamed protein product [Blepharisma stoltei]
MLIFVSLNFLLCQAHDFIFIYESNESSESKLYGNIFYEHYKSRIFFLRGNEIQPLFQELLLLGHDIMLFDLTTNSASHYEISKFAWENQILHFITEDLSAYYYDWTFGLKIARKSYGKSINSISKYYNWKNGTVFVSFDNRVFMEEVELDKTTYLIIEDNTNMENLINRVVFPLGSKYYYIFTGEDIGSQIVELLNSKNLLGNDSMVFLDESSGKQVNYEGSLILYETQLSSGINCTILDSIVSFLNRTIEQLDTFDDNVESKEYLQNICYENYCTDTLKLINIANSKNQVGYVKNEYYYSVSSITYPGGVLAPPINKKKVIEFSVNSGTYNIDEHPARDNGEYNRGTFIAVDEINASHEILKNYYLQVNPFDCGVDEFDEEYSLSCYGSRLNDLGVSFIPPYVSDTTIQLIKHTLADLNVMIPVISAAASDDTLSSITDFPKFARVCISNHDLAVRAAGVLKVLGWDKCAVLYQNDTFGNNWYNSFVEGAKLQNLKIMNDKHLRSLPAGYDSLASYQYVLDEVITSNARLVILVLEAHLSIEVITMFYSMGMRKGDLLFYFAMDDVMTSLYSATYTYGNLAERIELGVPAVRMHQEEYIGTVGDWVEAKIISLYGGKPRLSNYLACNFYDAVTLIAQALDWMVNNGLNYKDPGALMKIIRFVSFIGCSGSVKINEGTNDRLTHSMVFQSSMIDPDTGNITIYDSIIYSPWSANMIATVRPLLYAGNTTEKPSDERVVIVDCPFPSSKVRTFVKGRILVFCLCFFIAFITAILTFIIWKKWWHIKIEMLTMKKEISYEDFIVGITILIEFFQIISMGPDVKAISSLVGHVGDGFSLNLDSIYHMKGNVFWILISCTYGLTLLWLILCGVVLFQLDAVFPKSSLFKLLVQFSESMMPILGNLLFIPIISILLDVFVCDESIGENFTDSFLWKDCTQFCWDGMHIAFAVLSGVAILIYHPLAVFCRPLWQELQPMLHVKTSPLHLMVKTVFEIWLIVFNKTLKRASSSIHGLLFIAIIAIYITFIYFHKPYNYHRFSLWLGISLFGVLWISGLSTLNLLLDNISYFIWTPLLFSGWTCLIVFGYILQKKFPCMLTKKPSKDTKLLFKFAFTFGKASSIIAKSELFPHKKKQQEDAKVYPEPEDEEVVANILSNPNTLNAPRMV